MAWLFALMVLAWTRATGKPFAALGLRAPDRGLAPSIAGGFVFGLLFKVLMKAIAMPLFGAPAVNQPYHYVAGNSAALPGIIALVLVSGAFSEEVVYRGFLFERARALWGSSHSTIAAALVISTALFCVSHYVDQGWPGVVQAVFTGLTFGSIYAWRKELWAPMAAHAGFDLAAIAMIYANWEDPIAHWVFH